MRQIRPFFHALILTLLAGYIILAAETTAVPRVSVTVWVDGKPSPGLEDAIGVLLSQDGKAAVLERRQIDALLSEGALDRAITESDQKTKLGQLLGLDFFITLRITSSPEKGVIELVDALSGKVIANGAVASPNDPQTAVTAIATLLSTRPHSNPQKNSPSVAVIDFSSGSTTDSSSASLRLGLATELRNSLSEAGLTVLDRSFSDEVVKEHMLQENGMAAAVRAAAPLLGADYLIYGEVTADHVRLRLLHTAAAQSIGEKEFSLPSNETAVSWPPEALPWLLSQIQNGHVTQNSIAPAVQPEVLIPFYKGLGAFQEGRYLDARLLFHNVRALNSQFTDAYEWEARCYDALGLVELGNAERQAVVERLAEFGDDRPVKVHQSDGITFAGIHGENFDPLEIRRLEMETIDAITDRMPGKLQLPDDLARFRNEYDLFVGVGQSRGKSWSSTPNFLTRWSLEGHVERNEKSEITITWKILDTLSLNEKATVRTSIPNDAAETAKRIGDALSNAITSADQSTGFVKPVGIPPVNELLPKLSGGENANTANDHNQALLGILVQDPTNPALFGRMLKREGNVQLLLNYGLRDYLIAHLPPENSYSQWLELDQFSFALFTKLQSVNFLGKKMGVFDAMAQFRDSHPGRITACVAEYMILWENLDKLAPKVLLARLQKLRVDISLAAGTEEFLSLNLLEKQVDQLVSLVQLAYGLADPPPPLPDTRYGPGDDIPASRLVPVPLQNGKVKLKAVSRWRANDWINLEHPAWINSREEALAALHILGRGTEDKFVDPKWLKESPDSIALLAFTTESISTVGDDERQPMLYPFDAEAERRNFKELVTFCQEHLLAVMSKVDSLKQVSFLEEQTEKVILGLTHYAFSQAINDSEYDRIRTTLAHSIEETHHRLGDTAFQSSQLIWMKRTRAFPTPEFKANYSDLPSKFFDPKQLISDVEAAASWTTSPAEDTRWWNSINNSVFIDRMASDDFAAILLRHEPQIESAFAQRIVPKEDEFLFNYSLLLIHTSRYSQAERWLRKIIEHLQSSRDAGHSDDELYANALLQLGFCLRCEGRSAEAVPILKEAAGIPYAGRISTIGEITPSERIIGPRIEHSLQRGFVRHLAFRLLDEIRLDLLPSNLPSNVLCIPIQVPKLGGIKIDYYVRIPKGYQAAGTNKYPVILLAAPMNESTPEYCLDSNSWAQFADREGFFLVVPQFLSIFDFRVTAKQYDNPQNWSGDSTLEAIDQLSQRYRISKEKLFLHGYGQGGGFVQCFARWAPDRVAAVSSHSSDKWNWYETTQGLQTLSSQKNIPYLLTCGSEDNQNIKLEDRLHRGIRLTSNLRDQGADVIWREWPDVRHELTPQMESLSQAFLAYYAKNKSGAASAFIGDMRDGTYLPTKDARVSSIPVMMRQPLPDKTLAELWGTAR